MNKYLPLIIIFNTILFFSVTSLLSLEYSGIESSSIYLIFNIVLFCTSLLLFINEIFIKKIQFSKKELLLLILPFIIIFIFLAQIIIFGVNRHSLTMFLYFILWAVPGILMGIYINKNNRLKNLEKFVDIIMLIFSLGAIIPALETIETEIKLDIGGATYQTAGYIAALAFGINLYYLNFGKKHIRFRFAKTKIYYFFSLILIPIQVIVVFITGARGPMVLLITYIIYIIMTKLISEVKLKSIIKTFGIMLLTLGIFITFLPKLMQINVFERGFNRVFSYISPEGLDITSTSGRDEVYNNAIQMIFDSPFFGYGFFEAFNIIKGYPHNIFLEILLQGGIVYLLISLVLIYIVIRKMYYLIKKDSKMRIIIIIFLYPATMLLFSGTYTNNTLFWFCISFIFSVNHSQLEQKNLVTNIKVK